MNKPLDIDGNELKVGDDVEFAYFEPNIGVEDGCRIPYIGERFSVLEIGENECEMAARVEPELIITTTLLRLIKPDKKAVKKIFFTVEELTK